MGRIARRGPQAIPIMEKETKLKFPFLTVGSAVEVTSDEEGFQGAWYVAKILKSYVNGKPNLFLIQYETLVSENDSTQQLTETVDGSFIRPLPPPPPSPSQIYAPCDVVDAFHRDGWWKGVVTKVYARRYKRKLRRSYTVVFEDPPEQFNFHGDLLRFHHDWIDGRWVRNPKQKVLPNRIQCEEEEEEEEESVHEEKEPASAAVEEESAHEEEEEEESVQQQEEESVHVSLKGSSSSGNHGEEEQSSVKSSRKNPLEESASPSTTSTAKKQKIAAPEIEETFPNYSSKHNSSNPLSHGPIKQEAGSENATTQSSKNRETELDAQVTGQWFSTADGTNEDAAAEVINEQNVETFNHSSTVNEQAEREPVRNNKDQPFMKTSYMWKHIDSLEIFRILPQNPHFKYLSDCNEETREGSAIGQMVTFASLVEKVTKLQIDDPTSLFDRYLEALAILDEIGFDVKVVVDRVNDLLSLKTRQEHLDNRLKRYQSLVAECDDRKVKLEQDIDAVNKMGELVEQREFKVSQLPKKESGRNFLQLQVSSIKNSMFDVELEFKVKSSARWPTAV